MSKTFVGREDEVVVGTLVYDAFYPQNPGIVREIVSDETEDLKNHQGRVYTTRRVKLVYVEWQKATNKRDKITLRDVRNLQDLNQLIDDHKRSYENHLKRANDLKNMI